jgi:hypothetical protein
MSQLLELVLYFSVLLNLCTFTRFEFLVSDWHCRLFDPRIRIHRAILGAGYSSHLVNLRQIWLTSLRCSQMS